MKLMATPTESRARFSRTHRIALCGVLIACALVLSYVESLIPLPIAVPGIKLGIANTVSLLAIYKLNGGTAMAINAARIVLAGAMFTGFSAMIYGLAGGVLSVAVMIIVKKAGAFSSIGVSVAGAATHIFGQIALASAIIQSTLIFTSLPLLLLSAVVSGIAIGFAVHLILRRLE